MPDFLAGNSSTVQHFSIPNGQLYIDGQWCDAQDGQSKANINPATEETINQCAQATAVHTRDIKKALLAARQLQAGVVWINTDGQFDNRMPFGGVKASGVVRELGPEVLENYLQTKAVWLQTE